MKSISYVFISVLVINILSCTKSDESITNPSSDGNLIANSSFEQNGSPSLSGWQTNTSDSTFISYSSIVPQNGGKYSIKLFNEWSFPGTIITNIVPPIGKHRYRLSVWGKAIKAGLNAGGDINISLKNGSSFNFRKYHHFSDTSWVQGELLDTITTTSFDTIEVKLRGNIDQFSSGHILFDLCKFEKLD